MLTKREVEMEMKGLEEVLQQTFGALARRSLGVAAAVWGQPKGRPSLFIVMSSDNRADDDRNYFFTQ
jgi:hypothetical protein